MSNGSYTITGEFNGGMVTVNVPSPQFVTESLSVSANGTYTPGEGVDGYSQVVVDVPQSVTGFTQKDLTEGIQIVDLSNSASFVASYAFMNNKTIQTVNLPYATTVFGYAFNNCTSLTQVSLPVCSYIHLDAFQYCSSLTHIDLPMCGYINHNAFQYCSSLSQVNLPMCGHIDDNAFRNCTSLTHIDLPMCSFIGYWVFKDCSSLSIITIGYSSVCNLFVSNAFNNTPIASGTGSIYVPASLVDAYKSADNWSYYSSRIFPISE